jgi:hypothetical protein
MSGSITNTGAIWVAPGSLSPGNISLSNVNINQVGYTYTSNPSYNWNSIYNTGIITTTQPVNHAFQISHGSDWHLTISNSGEVEWSGPLSKNAERFIASVASNIDLQAAGKRALANHYTTVLERCLRQIKSMDKEEYIKLLENELAARKSQAVWDILCESGEDSETGA